MFFHVILTSECNLQCKYCFGESLDDFDEDFGDGMNSTMTCQSKQLQRRMSWTGFAAKTLTVC